MPNTHTCQNANITQSAHYHSSTASSSSRNSSKPLSEAFIAVWIEESEGGGSGPQVEAPPGVVHLEVCRLSRLTTSSSKRISQQSTTKSKFIKAPLDVKPAAGYKYEVLSPVLEDSGDLMDQAAGSTDECKVFDGLWDVGTTQASPKASVVRSSGQKHTTTSELQDFS
jgi:hypothetical protein